MKKANEWINVKDDVPKTAPVYRRCSANVEALLKDGRETIAYYVEDKASWYEYHVSRMIPDV